MILLLNLEDFKSIKVMSKTIDRNLKVYTSFVTAENLIKLMEQNYLPIFILRSIGRSDTIGKYSNTSIHVKDLSPSDDLFHKKRDNDIDFATFSKQYIEEICTNIKDFHELIKNLCFLARISNAKGIVLMGYGKDYETSHRKVLSDFLNSQNFFDNKITEFNYGEE